MHQRARGLLNSAVHSLRSAARRERVALDDGALADMPEVQVLTDEALREREVAAASESGGVARSRRLRARGPVSYIEVEEEVCGSSDDCSVSVVEADGQLKVQLVAVDVVCVCLVTLSTAYVALMSVVPVLAEIKWRRCWQRR